MEAMEQLVEINAAISAIERGGQEIRYNGQMMKRADIGVLYAERRRLENAAKIERQNYCDGWKVARFER